MKRYEILEEISKTFTDQLVICNIGIPSKELYDIKDREKNFYMLGSMGMVSSIAFGLAISQPEKQIWSIDGDGSTLMNLGTLCTIGSNLPPNLTIITIDNGAYGSTGNQSTHTERNTDLAQIARGAGFKDVRVVRKKEEIVSTLENLDSQCTFILIKGEPGNKQLPVIPLSPVEIKNRFVDSME
ncbi:MAG: sulfopyruvate decarboxylase subunit beta [Promethearchaeia archaeon]